MEDPRLSKCASNEALLRMIDQFSDKLFKSILMERIKQEGLTFNQRELFDCFIDYILSGKPLDDTIIEAGQ